MTCPHLSLPLLREGAAIIRSLKGESSARSLGLEMNCIHCRLKGTLDDIPFLRHFLDKHHYLCVQTWAPHELYCTYCGDFQYCDLFDKLIDRKRRRTITRARDPAAEKDSFLLKSDHMQVAMTASTNLRSEHGTTRFKGMDTGKSNGNFVASSPRVRKGEEAPTAESEARDEQMTAGKIAKMEPRGIVNMGSTCFMSSVLQILLHNEKFQQCVRRALPFNEQGALYVPQNVCSKGDSMVNTQPSPASIKPVVAVSATSSTGSSESDTGVVHSERRGTSFRQNSLITGSISATNNPCASGVISIEAPFSIESTTNATLDTSTKSEDNKTTTQVLLDLSNKLTVGCIACETRNLFSACVNESATKAVDASKQTKKRQNAGSLVPANFLYSIWTYAGHMAGYEQQDAHEFLIAFLDGLETHLRQYHSPATEKAPNTICNEGSDVETTLMRTTATGAASATNKNENAHNVSLSFKKEQNMTVGTCKMQEAAMPFQHVFSGTMESEVQCSHCKETSCTIEPFVDISLSLNDVSSADANAKGFQGISLLDSMKTFTASENIEELIFCEKCKDHKPCAKRLSILKLPDVLVFHLKRFDAMKKRKIYTKVNFALDALDLSPFTKSGRSDFDGCARECEALGAGGSLYDLSGVVTHKGSLNSGHYICYVAQRPDAAGTGKRSWIRCDDESLTFVDFDEVKNSEAYILFYMRRD